jgi:hypothetical protein
MGSYFLSCFLTFALLRQLYYYSIVSPPCQGKKSRFCVGVSVYFSQEMWNLFPCLVKMHLFRVEIPLFPPYSTRSMKSDFKQEAFLYYIDRKNVSSSLHSILWGLFRFLVKKFTKRLKKNRCIFPGTMV